MSLYVLRATMRETYNCPDEGEVHICDRYEDLRFSTSREVLDAVAADLNKGFGSDHWSEMRSNQLRRLHSNYDDQPGYTYSVDDVSHLMA